MALSLDKFAASLTETGLVTEPELTALLTEEAPADAEQLARRLVKRKLLTAYQAQQAFAGKAKALVLGNYLILDKLGQGGMGMVLKARHRRMNRIVALKVLSPAVVKTPDALARFHREVQAAARLEHQNIVIAYDADEANGTHFFVMQYVEGADLSSVVKSKGPLPLDQAIQCVTQAARGLEFAHRQGVIHRDIKPANLLLDGEGTVKILDMGLARIEGETGANAELTSTGTVMGTVDYMAPEQALSTKSADARSDIYSLGITLWYLLTGRAAYEGDSLMARLMAHANNPVPSLKAARPGVSDSLDSVFRRMVAKKPEDRFQTMTEVLAALVACRPGAAAAPMPAVSAGPSEESRFSELLGAFREDTSAGQAAGAKTRAGKSTVAAVTRAAEATVTSTRGDVGTDPVTLTSATKSLRRKKAPRPWWAHRQSQLALGAGGALIIGLLAFVLFRGPSGTPVGDQSAMAAATTPAVASPLTPTTPPATPPSAPGASLVSASPAPIPLGSRPSPSLTPVSLAARLLSPDEEWSPPVNLGPPINTDVDEANPRLSADGLRLWYRGRRGTMVASRASTDAEWSDPVQATLPNLPPPVGNLFVSTDERTLMFATWDKNAPVTLRVMQRASLTDSWPPPVAVETGTQHAGFPVMSIDRRALFFNNFSVAPTTGGDDICVVTRPNDSGPWQNPTNLGPLVNSPCSDRPSWISDDGTVLLFHTSREGNCSAKPQKYRLYWTHRSSPEHAWVAAAPLGIAAAPEDVQSGAILSSDGSTVYFESNRSGGAGGADIWMSRRIRKSSSPQSAGPKTSSAVETVDLLKGARLVDGALKIGGGVKVRGGAPHFFQGIPSGNDYTLDFELEREAGSGVTEFMLLVGGRSCSLQLHASPQSPLSGQLRSGLTLVDGQGPQSQSNPTSTGEIFVPDWTRFRLLCQVTTQRVKITIDGKTVVDWSGDAARLSPHANLKTSVERMGPALGLIQMEGTLFCRRATLVRGPVDFDAALDSVPRTAVEILTSADYEWTPAESLGPVVNSSVRNATPELSADELELWMNVNGQIAVARRPDLKSPFGPPEILGTPIKRDNSFDSQPDLSADGLTLYFASNAAGPQHPLMIWSSVRPSRTAPFEPPVLLPENINVPDVLCSSPSVTDDELVLFFASARTGGQGLTDLYEAKRARRTDPFGAVTSLGPTVNSPSIDVGCSISPDGLCLVFESNRPRSGDMGSGGGSDLYYATRKSRDLPFERAVSFGPQVNSDKNEHHPCLSRDGTMLIFELDRGGKSEIWMSRRVRVSARRNSP